MHFCPHEAAVLVTVLAFLLTAKDAIRCRILRLFGKPCEGHAVDLKENRHED